MKRTSPPVGVQARPVATPGSLVRRRCSAKKRRRPSSSRARLAEILALPSPLPSATSRATLRQIGADLALEVAHARLARVLLDDRRQGRVGELDLGRLQAVGLDLARDEVTAGDVFLLLQRVARQLDRLHPVLQRAGNRVEDVGRGDEHHLGEVELEVEVVVAEGVVLRRVEDLEHRRGGVAAEVGAHLVDLIDHEDGVAGAGVAQGADDRPRHRPDVGAPVAADLGLVAHAADADPLELAAQRLGDRFAEAGLADAGRADEAEDRPRRVGLELAHGQVLEDAVLDLFEVVVVGVEHLAGMGDVEVVLGLDRPGQLDQPLEVGADDAVLGGGRRQFLQSRKLALGCFEGVLGKVRRPRFFRAVRSLRPAARRPPPARPGSLSSAGGGRTRAGLCRLPTGPGTGSGCRAGPPRARGRGSGRGGGGGPKRRPLRAVSASPRWRSAVPRRSGGRGRRDRRCWRPPSAAPRAGRGSAR